MPKAKITLPAAEDLESIWDYISLDSPSAADRLIKHLLAEIVTIGANPGVGRTRDELQPGLRSWPSGNYIIYYRVDHGIAQILRVLHGARSYEYAIEER